MNDHTNHDTHFGDDAMNPSLDNINHLSKLVQLLSDADASKDEVCLGGSAPLALYGLRENEDIDLVAVNTSREKLYEYAKSGHGEVRNDGGLRFGEDLEVSPHDVFKNDHQELINDTEFYIRMNGWKIIRPEIILSHKGVRRRGKDEQDIKLMEESGIFEIDQWDWERVYFVPLWERNSNEIGLHKKFIKSIAENGVIHTTVKGSKFVRQKVFPGTMQDRILPSTTAESRLVDPLYTDLELQYPLPNLLTRQYTGGVFERDDIITTLLTKEGKETVPTIEKVSSRDVIITPSGKIHSEVRTLAEYCAELNKTSRSPLMINIQLSEREGALEPVSASSMPDLSSRRKELIEQRRYELLEQSGALFYSIIWPPANSMFDEIEALVADEFNIVESDDYYIKDGFGEFVRDIYSADERNEEWFYQAKRRELLQYDPLIRVCKLEVPDPEFRTSKESLLATEVYDAKIKIREKIQNLDGDYMYSTRLHMTDNFVNNLHVLRMLENINNKKYNEFKSD